MEKSTNQTISNSRASEALEVLSDYISARVEAELEQRFAALEKHVGLVREKRFYRYPQETAAILGVSVHKVKELRKNRTINYVREGGAYFVPHADIERAREVLGR